MAKTPRSPGAARSKITGVNTADIAAKVIGAQMSGSGLASMIGADAASTIAAITLPSNFAMTPQISQIASQIAGLQKHHLAEFSAIHDQLSQVQPILAAMRTGIEPQLAFRNTVNVAALQNISQVIAPALASITHTTHPLTGALEQLKTSAGIIESINKTSALTVSSAWTDFASKSRPALDVLGLRTEDLPSLEHWLGGLNFPTLSHVLGVATTRTLLGTKTPFSPTVDRIGKGWASIGDRALRGEEGPDLLLPASNRLASNAYQLDIIRHLGGDDLSAADDELIEGRRENVDQVAEWLETLDGNMGDRWVGMWDRMQQRGADWRSQAANSAVELMDSLLLHLAADDAVLAWHAEKKLDSGLLQRTGIPTRRLRLMFLGNEYRVSQITVTSLFMGVPDAIKSLQGIKHGKCSDEEFESWISLMGDVVAILLPNRRR